MMNLENLKEYIDLSKNEFEEIEKLHKQIITNGGTISYEIDSEIDCAKFIPKEHKIKITPNDLYSSIIHELLHVKTIIVGNFPDFTAIDDIRNNRLIFFKQFIIGLTNDLQHFIFYDEFIQLTQKSKNVSFIKNEKDFSYACNNEFKDYLGSNLRTVREKSEALMKSYKNNFIAHKYNHLLYKGDMLLYENNKNELQVKPFDTLFNSIVNSNNNRQLVVKAYELFFLELEGIINNETPTINKGHRL